MDDKQIQLSRSYRQKKRKRNKQIIYSFVLLALLFFIILLYLIFNGAGDDAKTENNAKANEQETVETTETGDNAAFDDETENENEAGESNGANQLEQEIVIQHIESDDPNVIEAYVGNWPPVGTVQKEPHVTDFTRDGTDWNEMKKAVMLATNIEEENLIELWFGNGGEQKVIATVKDRSTDEIFRVHIEWVESQGWQPTLVEKLKEYIQ